MDIKTIRSVLFLVIIFFIPRCNPISNEISDEQLFFSNEIWQTQRSSNLFKYIERMIKKWAPIVWLAPDEKYFPIGVPEFLHHVTPKLKPNIRLHNNLPAGSKSENWFLSTNVNIDELLQNSSSFLYGKNPNESKPVPVYAHIFECGPNSFQVTYWFFFPFSQGKTMCTLNMGLFGPWPIPHFNNRCYGSLKEFGSHVGDWEHTSFLFTGEEYPEEMYVSAHDAGAFYTFNRIDNLFDFKKREIRKGFLQRPTFPPVVKLMTDKYGSHPILFAAKGSHGLWTAPGKHKYVRLPRLYDVSGFGTAWRTWEHLEIIHPKKCWPKWMNYMGKWGNIRSNCHPLSKMGLNICQITDGPSGIPTKKQNFDCINALTKSSDKLRKNQKI